MEVVFRITKDLSKELEKEIEWALETRTRMLSRAQYPGIWKWTDRLSRIPSVPRSKRSRRFVGMLCLLFGILLAVPGLVEPQSRGLLAAGAVGILVGIWDIRKAGREKREKETPFTRSAQLLAQHYLNAADGQQIIFTENGMELEENGESETIAYDRVDFVFESERLLLVAFEEKILLLKKEDLRSGDMQALCAMLQKKLEFIPQNEQ